MDGAATPFYNYEQGFPGTVADNAARRGCQGRDVRVARPDPRKGLN